MAPLVLLTFFAAFLLIWSVFWMTGRGDRTVLKRLRQIESGAKTETETSEDTEPISPVLLAVRLFAKAVPLQRIGSRLDVDLARADIPLRGEEFIAGVILAGISGWAAGIALLRTLSGGAVIAVIAGIAPFVFLRTARIRRMASFNAQLGDALAMMSNTLRAGFGFAQALDMVQREMPSPISKEFSRCLQEMNLGLGTEEALQNLVDRVGSSDLDLMVTAVVIQRQVGGNLAEVLDKIHETIRERIRIKGEIKTLTAQGRVSGTIIGLLPVALALILFLINPAYLQELIRNPAGIVMIGYGVISEVVGVVLVQRIINIDV